jgi:PAS domain S-box-containing protein
VEAPIRVLVLEDRASDFQLIEQELRRTWPNAVCRCVNSESDYLAALAEGYDVVLADYALAGFDAMRALGLLHVHGLDVPLIVVSGANDEELVAECIKQGAADYLLKDRLARLGAAIARALMERVLRAQKTRAEVELRRSKEYYQRLVETVKAIPWELDPADWRFTYIGPQARRLLGYSVNNGCPYSMWLEKIHREDRSRVREALRDALLPNKDQDFVHRVLAADGGTVWMRSTVTSLCHDNGPQLLRGFTVDITSAKRAEQSLARRAEELARSNKDLEDFAYVASHDLQEPLRMVSSYTELLAERYQGRLDADADEFIVFITRGVARMQALIRDLLAYSRVTTRGHDIVPTDCEAVFLKSLENLRAAVLESGALVEHDPLPVVPADPAQLSQVFQNLLGNSIKFRGAAPPRVRVSARESADEWTISIADNGIGIDPQYSEVIFGLFQRLHTTQEYAGTGIGLTLCQKIVERHGGRIWVESQLGNGAAFHFTIPKGNGAAS